MAGEISTVLGKSIQITGEIAGAEDLIIHGRVHGKVVLTESRLTIGQDAVIQAEMQVHDAIILGQCAGDVTATGRLDLRKGSTLVGDIAAARLSVEDGAEVRGKVTLTGTKE